MILPCWFLGADFFSLNFVLSAASLALFNRFLFNVVLPLAPEIALTTSPFWLTVINTTTMPCS